MFTGLIEATGKIAQLTNKGSDAIIWIESTTLDFSDVNIGDSIAVNGVCLTVIELKPNRFCADVSGETLKCTCLGGSQKGQGQQGQSVNLEKALLPTTRMGGHLVSGHVDGIGEVISMVADGKAMQLTIQPPQPLMKYIAEKGSICVDGISLTVNELINTPPDAFRLTIVPHSMKKTNLGSYCTGTRVNLEVDLLARYMERLLAFSHDTDSQNDNKSAERSALTREKLQQFGFD